MIKIEPAKVRGAIIGGIYAACLVGVPTSWWLHLTGADHAGTFLKAVVVCAVFGAISGRGAGARPPLLGLRELIKFSIDIGVVNYAATFGLLLLAATPLTDALVLSFSSAASVVIGFTADHWSRRRLPRCTARQGRPAPTCGGLGDNVEAPDPLVAPSRPARPACLTKRPQRSLREN
ncbi:MULTISPECIES: hypothetical protein [unclassified Spirillospora]|uniref:hypothetical protein n=1 Tax=unclassified Spirillospora TaxID=2642701 RepID=UPI003711EA27